MKFSEFIKGYDKKDSVILLEGKRNVLENDKELLIKLGKLLCSKFRHAKFRSGNANGADLYFSKGVAEIDPDRLEIIVPYLNHRKKDRLTYNFYSMDEIDLAREPEIIYQTKSDPKNNYLIDKYVEGDRGKSGMKGSYLLRDTVKVYGSNAGIAGSSFAIFYDDLENPGTGGTGHTMKMCNVNNVPYIDQGVWMKWI